MKTLILTVCVMMFYFSNNAQLGLPVRPFEKINFSSFEYIWHEVTANESVLNDTLDGYNHLSNIRGLDPIVTENKVITAYLQKGPNHSFYGCLIECRDISTGAILWTYDMGHYQDQHQEIVKLMYIEDDRLVTINQLNKDPFDKNYQKSFYPRMIVSKRVYELSSGNILYYSHRPLDDDLAFETTYSPVYAARNYNFYREDENIRYIYQDFVDGKEFINSVLLDSTGALISKDTTSFKNPKYYFNFAQIHKDTFLSIQFKNDGNSLVFQYLSPKLKEYRTVFSAYIFDVLPGYILLEKISKDKSKLLFYNVRNSFYPDNYIEIYLFDRQSGKMLRKASLKDTFSEGFEAINWESQNDSLIIVQGRIKDYIEYDGSYSVLEIFKGGDKDYVLLNREYLPSDSLRMAAPYDFIKVNDNKYLIYFVELGLLTNPITNKINKNDKNGTALSMMLIDINSICKISDLSAINPLGSGVLLYPNPINDNLNIHFDSPYTGGLSISDIKGHIREIRQVSALSDTTINLSAYEAGIYFIQFYNEGMLSTKKVVKF